MRSHLKNLTQKIAAIFLASFVVGTPIVVGAQSTPIIVRLGEASAKKNLVAFPPLQYLGTPSSATNYQQIGATLFSVISNDLKSSAYFTMMDPPFVEDTSKTGLRPIPADPKGFSFAIWKKSDTDFLIRGAFSVTGKDMALEIYVYSVKREGLILGKKYNTTVDSVRKLAHTFSNDLLEALTGTPGPFNSKIVFASDRGGNKWREIYTSDWDFANLNKISNHRSIAMSPAWSPDGSKIAYTAAVQRSKTSPRNHDLFLYDVKRARAEVISFRKGMNSGASFAPDGKHIFLTISQGFAPDIYKMTYGGDLVTKVTNGPNAAMNVEPNVSADGSKVAFSSDRSGRTMIFTMNSDGGNVQRVTLAGQFNASPSWSPDGKKIAFAGYEDNHFDIFVVNADGTGMVRLTKAKKPNGKWSNNEDPSFSPDGRFVMYTSDRTGKNLIMMSTVDGSEERFITPKEDSNNYYKPRWSPRLE